MIGIYISPLIEVKPGSWEPPVLGAFRAIPGAKGSKSLWCGSTIQQAYLPDGSGNPNFGKPERPYCVLVVRADNLTTIASVTGVRQLMVSSAARFRDIWSEQESRRVGDLQTSVRNSILNALTVVGIDVGDIVSSTPIATILRRVLYHFERASHDSMLD